MNKKLLVMVMVPVLVVMSGALAFSAFTGGASTTVTSTAGNIDFSQNFTGYYLYGSAHPIDPQMEHLLQRQPKSSSQRIISRQVPG